MLDSGKRPQVSWTTQISERTGIGEQALTAYADAAQKVTREFPNCGIGWNTLAGIGFVESEHGTINESRLNAEGVAVPPIIGIPLDGTLTDAIPDTDHGALDSDTDWDRAVGPMQFIPSTWNEWGVDSDGDRVADPQNIHDAALSAARYLCAMGGDLTDAASWITAVASYNNTIDYNNRVAGAANHYGSLA